MIQNDWFALFKLTNQNTSSIIQKCKPQISNPASYHSHLPDVGPIHGQIWQINLCEKLLFRNIFLQSACQNLVRRKVRRNILVHAFRLKVASDAHDNRLVSFNCHEENHNSSQVKVGGNPAVRPETVLAKTILASFMQWIALFQNASAYSILFQAFGSAA